MNITPLIKIPFFPNGKRIALTLSFDDGHTFDRRVVTALSRWGMKATFNLNSGLLGRSGVRPPDDTWERIDANEAAELYHGHEVAVHTVSHPHLTQLSDAQIAAEVLDDRRALEDLVGYSVRGMAYPFGAYDERVIHVLRAAGIRYCRTVEKADPCFPPREPLAWAATGHQFDAGLVEKFADWLANPKHCGVFYVWGHSYEFHQRGDWGALECIFKPLSGHAEVWYCTNGELFDYEEARQRLVVAANGRTVFNPSALAVDVEINGQRRTIGAGERMVL